MTTRYTGEKGTTENPEDGNNQEFMLKARENALNAKEEARKAIGQVYEKSRHINPLDETLVRIFGETEQAISQQADILLQKSEADTPDDNNDYDFTSPEILDRLPIDIYPEIKRKTGGFETVGQSTGILSEEDLQQEIDDFIEETNRIKKEAQQALNEADITRQAARLTVNRVKQEAAQMAESEIARTREETRIIKENAESELMQLREENLRYREEAEAARNHARVAIALAQDKVKEASEKIARALEESRQSREESRLAKERAETSIRKVNEQIIKARKLIINSTPEDISNSKPVEEPTPEAPAIAREKATKTPSNDVIKELYDPLHSISGFARMMLDDNIADSAAQKEFLAIILRQSENLKQQLDKITYNI